MVAPQALGPPDPVAAGQPIAAGLWNNAFRVPVNNNSEWPD